MAIKSFNDYLVKLTAGAFELVREREKNLESRFGDLSKTNTYKADEDFHEYLVSLGAYEICVRVLEFYNEVAQEVPELKIPTGEMH